MTLVLTEVTEFGVVMVADTAETREITAGSGKRYTRVSFGTPKLFPIRLLRGGVSFWGAGELYAGTLNGPSRLRTDVWIEDFVATSNLGSLEQFAFTLRKTLNTLLEGEAPHLGFQVAGVRADRSPIFYRVANFDEKGGRRGEFAVEAEEDYPHLHLTPRLFADGDAALFEELNRRVSIGAELPAKGGHPIPPHTLEGRAEHHAAWVRFVSDLYQSAGLMRTIGGVVRTLRVTPAGDLVVTNL